MTEFLQLKTLDQKYRQVCGLYAAEKAKAEALAKRVAELEKDLKEGK